MRVFLIFIVLSSSVFAEDFDSLKAKVYNGSAREAISYINYLKSVQVDIHYYSSIEALFLSCSSCDSQVRVGLLDLLLQANRNSLYSYNGDVEISYLESLSKTERPRVVYDVISAVSKIESKRSLTLLKELGADERYVRAVAIALSDMCHSSSADVIEDLIFDYRNDKAEAAFIAGVRDRVRSGGGWIYRCAGVQ